MPMLAVRGWNGRSSDRGTHAVVPLSELDAYRVSLPGSQGIYCIHDLFQEIEQSFLFFAMRSRLSFGLNYSFFGAGFAIVIFLKCRLDREIGFLRFYRTF